MWGVFHVDLIALRYFPSYTDDLQARIQYSANSFVRFISSLLAREDLKRDIRNVPCNSKVYLRGLRPVILSMLNIIRFAVESWKPIDQNEK